MNIFLIGYRCTGKTSVGRVLAASLARPFVDTDARIVSLNHQSIHRLVDDHGWPAFRRKEKQVLKDVCAKTGQVVATGGGIVLDAENVALMKQTGRVVLLTAGVETIRQRMHGDDTSAGFRPSLTGNKNVAQEIQQTLSERMPLYKGAMEFCFDTRILPVENIAQNIVSTLQLQTER
jgi:shikimate kinase